MDNSLKKVILVTTSLGAYIVPFMNSSVNIALPSMSRDFTMSSIMLNWIALSFTLSIAIFILPFGRLADILGRKKLLLWGMSIFAASSVLCGISFSPAMLILTRIIQGISGATISVTVVSMLVSVFSAGERGKALGLNVAMTYTGLSTGPYLGGLLTKYFGWRSIFFAVAFIAILVVISLVNIKDDWAEAKGEKFDYTGSAVYGISLLGIIWGFSVIRSALGIVLTVAGLVALIVFVYIENREEYPILNIALFKNNRVLAFSSLAALISYSATFALSYLLSLYLQYNKGFDPTEAGLIIIAQPVVMTILSPLAGILSDRIEPQRVASIGMTFTTIGLGFFIFLNENTGIPYIIAALLILGFGFALFSSPNTNAVMSSVEKKYYGIASGILGAARSVGQTLSMGISSLVIAVYIGNEQINSMNAMDLLMAVRVTFTILTVLCFAGIFASIARGKLRV